MVGRLVAPAHVAHAFSVETVFHPAPVGAHAFWKHAGSLSEAHVRALRVNDTVTLQRTLYGIRDELQAQGGKLELSDLFRSYDMQLQAHLDYTSGKKKAFSPPPGSSMHESGRAFDVDLAFP